MVWCGVIGGGFVALGAYGSRPGEMGEAPGSWPAVLGDKPPGWVIVASVHTRCPCTQATVTELEGVLARAREPVSVIALLYVPAGRDDWPSDTTLERRLAALGADVRADVDAGMAWRLGAFTSGHVVLYDDAGERRFFGGITPSRAHTGPNTGSASLMALLRGETPVGADAPVYGCPIKDLDRCVPAGIEP